MEKPKPKQAVYISWDLFSKLMVLRGRISTADQKVKLYQLVEKAIENYLQEVENP